MARRLLELLVSPKMKFGRMFSMRLSLAAQHERKSPEAKQGCGRWLRNGKGEIVEVACSRIIGLYADIQSSITCITYSEILSLCATGGVEPGEATAIIKGGSEYIV